MLVFTRSLPAVIGLALVASLINSPAKAAAAGPNVEPVAESDIRRLPSVVSTTPRESVLSGASATYVMHASGRLEQDVVGSWKVLRTADGSVVRELPHDLDAARTFIAGSRFVQVFDETKSTRFTDIESGAVVGTVTPAPDEDAFHVAEDVVLVKKYVGNNTFHLWVKKADGTAQEVTGVDAPANPISVIGQVGDHVFVRAHGYPDDVVYDIDLSTATRRTMSTPTGFWWGHHQVVGPTRLFDLYRNGSSVRVTWFDRENHQSGSTTVDISSLGSVDLKWAPYGEGLAAYPRVDGNPVVRPLELGTGTVGDPVTERVNLESVLPLGDGRLAVAETGTAPGRISIVEAGVGARTVADFPNAYMQARSLRFSGDVQVEWHDSTTWQTAPDGDSGWEPSPPLGNASGSARLTQLRDDSGVLKEEWELAWPGGSRVLKGSEMRLGHGGLLVSGYFATPDGTTERQVQRVSSDEVVARPALLQLALDGSTIWTMSTAGVLTGVDVNAPESEPRILETGHTNCNWYTPLDVRGRWALTSCAGVHRVVDLLGIVPTWDVAMPPYRVGTTKLAKPQLGNGFVVWPEYDENPELANERHRLVVADLSSAHTVRVISDYLWEYPQPADFAVDEEGSAAIAYIDKSFDVSVATLPWLGSAPTIPDTTAPALSSSALPGGALRSGSALPVTFSWTFSDDAPATNVVRFRTKTGTSSFTDWQPVPGSGATAALTRSVVPGQRLCAQAQATDASGNSSSWTAEHCTYVDGAAPTLRAATGAARYAPTDSSGRLTYGFSAGDDFAVGSYDVATSVAARGGARGAWTTRFSGVTGTSVRVAAARGSEWCFRFRARDVAGNVSGWSPARCTSVAIDDRELAAPSGSRFTSGLAFYGTYTKLTRNGMAATLRDAQRGSTLAFWAIKGPTQGEVDVFVGGVRAGRVRLNATTDRRSLVVLRMPRSGAVRFVQVGRRPVRIDAVAVGR